MFCPRVATALRAARRSVYTWKEVVEPAANVAVLQVPVDNNISSSHVGAAGGPAAIVKFMENTFDWGNLNTEQSVLVNNRFFIAPPVKVTNQTSQTAREQDFAAIKTYAQNTYDANKRMLALGGDHSVTYPLVAGLMASKQWPKGQKISILHFDAHPDLFEILLDNRLSHASPFARIVETLPVARLVQLGLRAGEPNETEFAHKYDVEQVLMRDHDKVAATSLVFHEPLYITIDVDVIDPSEAPGVSHRESGGMTVRELLRVLYNLDCRAGIAGIDLVEYNPVRDIDGMTLPVCHKLFKELIALMEKHPWPRHK